MMDQSYPPENRLHHGREYSRAFNRQQKAAGRFAVVLVSPRKPGAPARLGVMVSAKTAPRAVDRHRMKRWMRELFRTEWKDAAAAHDVVVLMRSVPDDHLTFSAELRSLLPKALAAKADPRKGPRR